MMGNKVIEQIVNPFIRIAGMKALGWGVLGLLFLRGSVGYPVIIITDCFISVLLPIRLGGVIWRSI